MDKFRSNLVYCKIGIDKNLDSILVTLVLFSRSPCVLDCENEPCLQSILLSYMHQICMETSAGQGQKVISFWWPWPYFQGYRGQKNICTPESSLLKQAGLGGHTFSFENTAIILHLFYHYLTLCPQNLKRRGTYCFLYRSCRHWHRHSLLSMLYLVNRWVDFDQIKLTFIHQWDGGN